MQLKVYLVTDVVSTHHSIKINTIKIQNKFQTQLRINSLPYTIHPFD